MHLSDKRKSCRVHDRQIDRNVCRSYYKKRKAHRPNKLVSEHWREFSEG